MRVLTLDSRFAPDKAVVRRLQFAPDGRRFAARFGPVPHAVAVYDTPSGAVLWEVPGGGAAVGEPAISPDLDAVAWAEDDGDEPFGQIRVWTRWDNRPRYSAATVAPPM